MHEVMKMKLTENIMDGGIASNCIGITAKIKSGGNGIDGDVEVISNCSG